MVFNEKDHLQDDVLAAHGIGRPPVVHRVPTTAGFHEAVRRGLGWGLIPDEHLESDLASGALRRLPGARPVEVLLHWQRWKLDSPALVRLTEHVRRVAVASLRRPRSGT